MATNEVSCWNCANEYSADSAACPQCNAVNANVDLLKAIEQLGVSFPGVFKGHVTEPAD